MGASPELAGDSREPAGEKMTRAGRQTMQDSHEMGDNDDLTRG